MCLTQKKRDRCSCTFKKFWLAGPAGGFVVEDKAGRANGYLLPLKTTKEDTDRFKSASQNASETNLIG